jgi:hydrogenase-4 component H
MLYDGSRCTYCGRCADVCPEKAITISTEFELATGDREDVTERLELFMLTCQRCGRCYDMENTNAIERMDLRGYRYDSLETRALIRKTTDQFDRELFEATKNYQRPVK